MNRDNHDDWIGRVEPDGPPPLAVQRPVPGLRHQGDGLPAGPSLRLWRSGDLPMRARTELLRPWQIARRGGQREGRAGIPESDQFAIPPTVALLADLGRAELAEHGQAWWSKAAGLEAACHHSDHGCERAALDTDAAVRARAVERERREAFNRRVADGGGDRRGLSTWSYRLLLIGLAVGEAYFSYLSLLVLGEDRLRWAGVITLGITLLLLARALGTGWRELHERPAPGLSWVTLLAIGVGAAGLILAQAKLRAQAVTVLLTTMMGTDNLTGSSGAVPPPVFNVAPWWIYAVLQGVIFLAATWASWAHANPDADQSDELRRAENSHEQRFRQILDAEQSAADRRSTAQTAWGAAFAERCQAAERSRWLNTACQERYWHFNLIARHKAAKPTVRTQAVASVDSGWRSSPSITRQLGADAFPIPRPVWDRFIPAIPTGNGHSPQAGAAWRDRLPEVRS